MMSVAFGLLALLSATAAPPRDVMAFHAPWDAASAASIQQHGGSIGTVVPAWMSVTGPDHAVTIAPDPNGRAALASLAHKPKLLLMVQNALLGTWDGAGAAALLHDPAATTGLLDRLVQQIGDEKASGAVIDLEALPTGTMPDLQRFLAQARGRLKAHGWSLMVTVPVADPQWDAAALAGSVDRVILMAYDQHYQGGEPGPIAADDWFATVVGHALKSLPAGKAIVAVASYAYDWSPGQPTRVLSIPQALDLARGAGVTPADEHFTYTADGATHQVWMMTAGSVRRQMAIATRLGAAGVALWRLGSEDPAIWPTSPPAGAR
jgi:spore germination protein YaaH